jgi:hypothetical protein
MLVLTTKSLDTLIAVGQREYDAHPLSGRSPVYKQLGVSYRWSSIVTDEQPKSSYGEKIMAYLPEDNMELRAGDRAPDASNLVCLDSTKSASTSLFQILQPTRHTIVLFDPTPDQLSAVVSAFATISKELVQKIVIRTPEHTEILNPSNIDGIFVDTCGHANAAYHPAKQGFRMFIVRPDGVVGAIAREVSGLQKYFASVFSRLNL